MHVFDLYFATVYGWQMHPGRPSQVRLTMRECAEIAAQMVVLREEFIEEGFDGGLERSSASGG